MRVTLKCLLTLMLVTLPTGAWGHGINLSVNTTAGIPTSFTPASQDPLLDAGVPPTPSNRPWQFLGKFSTSLTTDMSGSYYNVNDGFTALVGTFPGYSSATYTIVSPLYYADGSGPAVLASSGTHLDLVNRFPGGASGHTGAEAGGVSITGTTGELFSPGVSLIDTHELSHRLYLDPSSTQVYGEYGFAFTITVNFTGGPSLTSDPMLGIYATRISDPLVSPLGAFTSAPLATQQAATLALIQTVPEPSSLALAGLGTAALGLFGLRVRRRSSFQAT